MLGSVRCLCKNSPTRDKKSERRSEWGMPLEVCSDLGVMFTNPTYPVVVLEPPSDSNNTSQGLRIMGS